MSRREAQIRELIGRSRGLRKQVFIDAYRHLVFAHMVGSQGGKAAADLDRDGYRDQGVFGPVRTSSGKYDYALDTAREMLEANIEHHKGLTGEVRAALQAFLDSGVLDDRTPAARGRSGGEVSGSGTQWAIRGDVEDDPKPAEREGERSGSPELGLPYSPVDERPAAIQREPFPFDPNERDRATLRHRRTQNELHELAVARGYETRRPDRASEPDFDLACTRGDVCILLEVKTLSVTNEAKQLRLGLGQLIDYQDELARQGHTTEPVLAVDSEPSDLRWAEMCESHGVRLVWPECFHVVFE